MKKGFKKILFESFEKKRGCKKGQVLIEAVIYILIAFTLIGLVLSFAYPEIQKMQDKALIGQSIEMMQDIADTINELRQGGAGNQRLIELGIKKGTLTINPGNNSLTFETESSYIYSEPGKYFNQGDVQIRTNKIGEDITIELKLRYNDDFNLTYQEKEETKILNKAAVPYKIIFMHKGKDNGNKILLNIGVE